MEKTMRLKNRQMDVMTQALETLTERADVKGLVAYAAARNLRILKDAAQEYFQQRDALVAKYGERETVDGKPTGRTILRPSDDGFADYCCELDEITDIEHEVTLYVIPVAEGLDVLTGREWRELDWMFEEADAE